MFIVLTAALKYAHDTLEVEQSIIIIIIIIIIIPYHISITFFVRQVGQTLDTISSSVKTETHTKGVAGIASEPMPAIGTRSHWASQ